MERDLQEARGGLEDAMRDRANMEKNCKMSQALIVEPNQKLDELARALNEANSTKKWLQVESQDLNKQIEENKNAIANLTEAETMRMKIDEEAEKRTMCWTPCPKLRLRSSCGSRNRRLKLLAALMSWKTWPWSTRGRMLQRS